MSRSGWLWRLAVPTVGAVALAGFALLYHEAPQRYAEILTAWGLDPFRIPFLDSQNVLGALDCARLGYDTYRYDPCDVLTRAFGYSPFVLEATVLPLTAAWNNYTGLALAMVFLIAAASLPAPRNARDAIVMALALLSTVSVYAIERANIDLLLFALLVAAGHLLRRGRIARGGGYGLILFGAAVKFYPAVALFLALKESPRRFAAVAATSCALIALFLFHYRAILGEAMAAVPFGSYYTDFFGAMNLPFGLARLLSPISTEVPGGALLLAFVPWAIAALLLASALRQAIAYAATGPALPAPPDAAAIFLLLGAAIIVGCFFAGQNIGYRGIYFVLTLPGLLALSRQRGAPPRLAATLVMILFLMWSELFREALFHLHLANAEAAAVLQVVRVVFWFVRELIWWRVIASLGGILIGFALASPVGRWAAAPLALAERVPR